MAFLKTRLLAMVLMLSCCAQFSDGRKLFGIHKMDVPSLDKSLILTALPKGSVSVPVPFSNPSKKGHAAALLNAKHSAHSPFRIDRSLESIPSPGIGH